jgi:pyruvate formate lyase activating enzyme
MKIKGFQKTSLIDFKPYIASVIFVGGCSFRCGYCYNPDLVLNPNDIPDISEKEIFDYIESKKTFIDGVCITGGEPCIYPELIDFCKKLKDCGFLVKINTNGSRPEILKELIEKNVVDKISMDIKSSFDNYDEVAGVEVDKDKIKESIRLIMNSGIDYSFNTTAIPGLVDKKEIFKIAKMIKGAKKYNINDFQSDKELVGKDLEKSKTFSKEELEKLKKIAEEYLNKVELS